MRYNIGPAEQIRQRLRVTEEQFSVMLGYSPRAYPIAVARKKLTPRMAREIATRYKISLSKIGLVEEAVTCTPSGSCSG